MTKIAVTGASGRMGKTILGILHTHPEAAIGGACDLGTASTIRQDIGRYLGNDPLGIPIEDSLPKALHHGAQAVIDFTSPAASVGFAQTAALHAVPIVIGTTGLDDTQKKALADCAAKIPIVLAPNMSVGVNTLFKLIADAAKLLGPAYDIEIIEAHHRLKKDAPSGTAVRMAEILAETTGRTYPNDINFHREGLTGPRTDREIGMQTIRGGDIVGDHTAMFCGIGERLEITHIATSRDTFAQGAIRAALWAIRQKPGLYDMQDVLGIRR